MGLRKIAVIVSVLSCLTPLSFRLYADPDPAPVSLPPPAATAAPSGKVPPHSESKPGKIGSEQVTPYSVVKEKSFPNYKVEIQQRMTISKFPRVESMKARIIPTEGGSPVQIAGTWLNPDPKAFVTGWEGGLLDVDGDGLEDLVLQNYSGAAHCCYNYIIYSLAKPLKKLGDIPMKDCGEKIDLEDLNGDKKLELISCNPNFVYLGDLPYSESPFPPAIYTLKNGQYERADKEFKQVFLDDIQSQKDALAKSYRAANALQIVADYLVLGDDAQAWKEFDARYKGADKDKIKQQLQDRMAGKPGGVPAASSVPSAWTTLPPAPSAPK